MTQEENMLTAMTKRIRKSKTCEKNEWQHHTQLKNTMDSLIKRHTWDMTQEGHVLGRDNTGLMRPSHEKGITC